MWVMRQKTLKSPQIAKKKPLRTDPRGFLSFDVLQSSRLLAVLPSNSTSKKQQAYVNPINLKNRKNRLQKIWRYLSLRLTNFQTGSANRKNLKTVNTSQESKNCKYIGSEFASINNLTKEIENDRNRNHKTCARCYNRINRNNWNSHSLKKIRIRCFPK